MRYKVEFLNDKLNVIAVLYFIEYIDRRAVQQFAKSIQNCAAYSLYFTDVNEVKFVSTYTV